MVKQGNAARLLRVLQADRLLRRLAAVARQHGMRLYLVGGSVRDLLRGSPLALSRDWDFAVDRGAVRLARAVADAWGAAFVLLDQEHGVARVVCGKKQQQRQLDFADFRAATLKEDLRRRDFTINTLCVDVSAFGASASADTVFFDYWGAQQDLQRKLIRVIRPQNLRDDPLRVVRGFSLCSQLGFTFAPQTAGLLATAGRRLGRVAGERITQELAKLFGCGRAFPALQEMARAAILERLFPELACLKGLDQGAYHHLDGWQHSLETVRQFELLRRRLDRHIGPRAGQQVRRLLDEDISGGRPRGWIVALACLLHDVAKPATRFQADDGAVHFYTHDVKGSRIVRTIGRRFKLAGREIALLARLVQYHVRPGQLVNRRPSSRAMFRFVRDMGADVIPVILLTIADRGAMRGRLSRTMVFHEQVLWRIVKQQAGRRKPAAARLLDGHDIMRLTKSAPGPQVGRMLAAVEEAQALGEITTSRQATAWLEQHVHKKN